MADAMMDAVLDVERHVATIGWDQATRLFALVPTRELLAVEPALAAVLGPGQSADEHSLTPVEQEDLPPHTTLEELLASITWPHEVRGTAVVVERLMLPSEVESTLPTDEGDALRYLAEHPARQEMRLAVGVLRDGRRACAIRLRAHDEDGSVIRGADLAPGLAAALAATLED